MASGVSPVEQQKFLSPSADGSVSHNGRQHRDPRGILHVIEQARQIDLKYKSLEAEQKRMMTHQRSALLDLQWRLDIEDRSERAQERVDKFMAQRDKDMALGRSGDAEREGKRQRVYNQAKQLLASRTSHLMDKREAFEKRHAEMQAQREFEAHMREVVSLPNPCISLHLYIHPHHPPHADTAVPLQPPFLYTLLLLLLLLLLLFLLCPSPADPCTCIPLGPNTNALTS